MESASLRELPCFLDIPRIFDQQEVPGQCPPETQRFGFGATEKKNRRGL
jgi:hypothetical protein